MDSGLLRQRHDIGARLEMDAPRSRGETAHHPEERAAPPAKTAAPKVFGISIYLIIAYLVLLYLMFRTGSMF